MNPFDIINELNTSTKDNFDDIGENGYNSASFIVDRAMSYHIDTVMLANEITRNHTMPAKWKYDFYRYAITPKKKRYSKWAKPEKDLDIELIMVAYNVNRLKAIRIHSTINKSMDIIHETMNYGGAK